MPSTYKVLAQLSPSAATPNPTATVGAAKSWVASSLVISNLTGDTSQSTAYATVSICVNGAAASNSNTIIKYVPILPGTTVSYSLGITMGAGDIIRVSSTSNDVLSFNLFGVEIS